MGHHIGGCCDAFLLHQRQQWLAFVDRVTDHVVGATASGWGEELVVGGHRRLWRPKMSGVGGRDGGGVGTGGATTWIMNV